MHDQSLHTKVPLPLSDGLDLLESTVKVFTEEGIQIGLGQKSLQAYRPCPMADISNKQFMRKDILFCAVEGQPDRTFVRPSLRTPPVVTQPNLSQVDADA